jgi:hypothetical protein
MENYANKAINKNYDVCYYNSEGEYHRIDGPAVTYHNGDKGWYINGKTHRENGPAVEYVNGDKSWYINGRKHRLDGPAMIWSSRIRQWYIYNTRYSKSKHNRLALFLVLEPRRIDINPTEK